MVCPKDAGFRGVSRAGFETMDRERIVNHRFERVHFYYRQDGLDGRTLG